METDLETMTVTGSAAAIDRDMIFTDLYESAFPAVARFVRQMNGTYEDAKDIFQDAVIIYYERISWNQLSIDVSPGRYVHGIAKHLWLKKFKADRKKIPLSDFEKAITIPVDFFPSVNTNRMLSYLEASGRKCLDLLRNFYFEKMPLTEIAAMLGYGSEHSASVQKYKCLEKIRETIKENAATYEDFFE